VGQRWHLWASRVCGCCWLQKANVDGDTPAAVLLLNCSVELEKQLIGVEFVAGGDFVHLGSGEGSDFLDAVVYAELGLGQPLLDGFLNVSVR
jgi:hypothetical protein